MKKIKVSHSVIKKCAVIILGNIILAFGLYNIHAHTKVSEGGILGLMLLIEHWTGISPAYSGFVMDILCYAFGWKVLGTQFLGYSAVACVAFSASYKIFELFPPLFPQLVSHPALAAVAGAVFVGVGVGLSVRAGAATGGDDAVVMALSKLTKLDVRIYYLISDISVLALSLTYIPFSRIIWSLLTVVLSGQIIGQIQKAGLHRRDTQIPACRNR